MPKLFPWVPKGLVLKLPGVVKGMRQFLSVPTPLPHCLQLNGTLVKALGTPLHQDQGKDSFLYGELVSCLQAKQMSRKKSCTSSSSSLSADCAWLAAGKIGQQGQYNTNMNFHAGSSTATVDRAASHRSKVRKRSAKATAVPGTLKDGRSLCRSKSPKRVWINLLITSKGSQIGKASPDLPGTGSHWHFITLLEANKTNQQDYYNERESLQTETHSSMGSSKHEKAIQKGEHLNFKQAVI